MNKGLEVKDGLISHISFICIFPLLLQVNMGLEIKDAPVDILNAPEIALVSPKPSRGSMVQKKPNNHDDEHKLNQKVRF